MMDSLDTQQSFPTKIILNFLLVYVIWGSTYLAIKVGITEFPPLFMSATRFFLAGLILAGIGKLRREAPLVPNDRKLAVMSGSLLCCANGLVCVAEKWIPSGLAAMIIGTIPAWITIIHWRFFSGNRPNLKQSTGILISLCGIAFLARSETQTSDHHRLLGIMALLCSVILWSFGTLTQRTAGKLDNIFTFSGTQLAGGSFASGVLALCFEGPKALLTLHLNTQAVLAFVYLVIFGSVIAFSCYLWLSRNVSPTKVSTYAVVNPLVAVWLGWLFANEPITLSTIVASLLVIAGIYFVIFDKSPARVRAG